MRLTAALAIAVSFVVAAAPKVQAPIAAPIVIEEKPATSGPSRLVSDDRILLDEYRLAEKVEARVLGDMKVYGAILGLALAFIGFLGFQVVVDALTRRLERTAKEDLEAIRSRTQTALVDLELAVREGQRISAVAAEQVSTLRQRHAELEDLAAKYQDLHSQVQSIGQRVEQAATVAAESQEKVAGLSVALSNTFAGSPALFMSSFDWERGGAISGRNFGNAPGKLHLSFHSRFTPLPGASASGEKMGPIEVSGTCIEGWTDTGIIFQVPEPAMDAIRAFRAKQEELWARIDGDRKGDRSLGYEVVVERTDGVKGTF